MKRAGSTPILPALLTALLVCSAIASAVDKSGYDSQVLEASAGVLRIHFRASSVRVTRRDFCPLSRSFFSD